MQIYIPSVQIINRDGVFFQGAYLSSIDFPSAKHHPDGVIYTMVFLKLVKESMHYHAGIYDFHSALAQLKDCYSECAENDFSSEEEEMLVNKTIERYEYFPIAFRIGIDGYDPDTVSAHSLCLCMDTMLGVFRETSFFRMIFAAESMRREPRIEF